MSRGRPLPVDPGIARAPVFFDHEAITVSSTAVHLDASVFLDANYARIYVESAAIRFFVDNTADPTATVGEVAGATDTIILDDPSQLQTIGFIRRDGTDATLTVQYGVVS